MRKLILITLMTLIIGLGHNQLNAEMRYDPVQNVLYSHPQDSSINHVEYVGLIVACIELSNRLVAMNNGRQIPIKEDLEQAYVYLKSVGTPTALRLIKDLKANAIYYKNGAFMRKIY